VIVGRLFALFLLLPALGVAGNSPALQELIDQTADGETLLLEPGVYAGPVLVTRPITIDGQNKATIDAGGKGSVVVLKTDGATLKNLHLTNSGESNNDIDSGVQVRGNFNVIKDNRIDNCLFGVDLQQSRNNIVKRNYISSKPDFDLGQKGDSVRLWYSFDNKILDNVSDNVRDMVVWYSSNNVISGNRTTNARYSLHFMYSRYNLVENNHYVNNSVGVFLMYSDSVVLRNNHIAHAAGPTGVGIGFKETSDLTIENNEILYCASGLYIDVSPYQPDTINRFSNNTIAYNGIGIRFLNDWHSNVFKNNRFVDNLTQIVVSGGGSANRNDWEGNYWSDYEGFDQDADGVGDSPYELYAYADRLWQNEPYAQFFKGSPLLEVLDFLERLAPFSEPRLMVRDSKPYLNLVAKNESAISQVSEKLPENKAVKDDPADLSNALDLLRSSLEN
jgi:nitrous oxidase accessory protein